VERLPLTSVRTFAVVARLLSISRAAEELNVTPSAVSHQIKVLEDYLSASLFRREKNQLKLTAAGQLYMSQVSEGLLLLAQATKTIKAAKGQQALRIAAPPSFAVLWLVDRIARFLKQHPDIGIDLTTVPDLPPMQPGGGFDLGFWYGSGMLSGLSTDSLGANCAFPICAPRMLEAEHGIRSHADLKRHTLLDSNDEAYYNYKEPRQPGWDRWLSAAGIRQLERARVLSFTPRLVMHRAVAAGVGVGMSRSLLAADALAAKDLAVPFGPVLPLSVTYHMVYASNIGRRKDVATFREWICAEAAASRKKVDRALKRFM